MLQLHGPGVGGHILDGGGGGGGAVGTWKGQQQNIRPGTLHHMMMRMMMMRRKELLIWAEWGCEDVLIESISPVGFVLKTKWLKK